jgi:ATP-dependent RNA helicase DDX46/PRP5
MKDADNKSREVSMGIIVTNSPCHVVINTFLQASKGSTPAPPPAQTDEEKKAERLAKLEAWKQKQAVERERKQRELAASGGARSILDEIDKRSGLSPAVGSPQSPIAAPSEVDAPSYTGKFDPKAITKKPLPASTAPSLLGRDVAVPDSAKPNGGIKTNSVSTTENTSSSGESIRTMLYFLNG